MRDKYDDYISNAGNIRALLDRSADPTLTDDDSKTPRQLAEEQGANEEILRLLRER